jgi:hypothetical protein
VAGWVFPLAGFRRDRAAAAGIREAGCAIEDLQLTQTDLEDVFVGVMQGRATRTAERLSR